MIFSKQIRTQLVASRIAWMYLRTISWVRIINIVQLQLSYVYSALLKRACIWGRPWAVSIEPLNVCNLQCPECPTGLRTLSRHKGMVDVKRYQTMLHHIGKTVWHVNLYFQGEPFMHPDFFALVKEAKKARLVVETSTNAQFLSYQQAIKTVKSGLDILVVSLDGMTQPVYEEYRVGGQLSKVLDGILNLVKAKRELGLNKPIIRAQFIAFHHNQHQIGEFKKTVWAMGVDMVEVKKAQIYGVENKVHMLPTDARLSRYKVNHDGSVGLGDQYKHKCWKHWSSAVLTWEGDLLPCCFDKDAKYIMGNIYEQSMVEVWSTPAYLSFRRNILLHQNEIDICNNCPLSRK